MSSQRIAKVVLISVPAVKGYHRWVYRAVECEPRQAGYINERGVVVLWESRPLYRPNAAWGKGPEAKAHAKQVAAERQAEQQRS